MRREVPHNPQQPFYKIRDEEGKLVDIGFVVGSSPKKQYFRQRKDEMDNALKSRDIVGNLPGTKVLGNFHTRERRQVRNLVNNSDIEGSNPGSLIRGIKMPQGKESRVSNPLQPTYVYPGATESPIDILNDPYGEKGCSMSKVNLSKRQSLAKPPLAK
mmetsp:Transcript_7930/g.13308  ORF Transcript_7930/g.13308 Transcript_7930/m.13308 type:complete len:158 (+) Transcript_7930:671-1144(+)